MHAPLIWLTCVACLIGVPVAHAQSISFAPTTHAAASGVRGAVSVDLNGDGWLDIATANTGRNTVWIMVSRGAAGGFVAAPEIPVGIGPFDIAAGDADRDGIQDLLVTTPDEPAITLLLMNRDATARTRFRLLGPESRGATLADVTRDGILDLVYTEYSRAVVSVRPGDGTGNFVGTLGEFPVSANPQDVIAADFNHDGFLDLAVASSTTSSLNVLYGTGTGSFTRRTFFAGRSLNVLAAEDINADGWLDIAAAASATHVVAFFRGSASGFVLAGTRATGASPRGITSGDFNHDGRPDFVTSNFTSSSVTVLLGRRDGVALADRWGDLPAGTQTRGIVAGDFNHDGRTDFAARSQQSRDLVLFANDTAFVRPGFAFSIQHHPLDTGSSLRIAPADFNENGKIDLAHAGRVLLDGATVVTYEPNPSVQFIGVAAVDFDRDGHTDIAATISEDVPRLGVKFNGVQVWHGNGRGGFTPGPRRALSAGDMAVGDFNRDDRTDLIAVGFTDQWVLHVLRRADPEPVLTVIPLPGFPSALRVADVNRDAILDVLTMEFPSSLLSIRLGDGKGGFKSPSTVSLPPDSSSFEVADLNQDGRADLVVAAGPRVTVILATAQGGWAPPVHFASASDDFASLDALWLVTGDYDGDGLTDVFTGNGVLLPGNGDGTLGAPAEFLAEPNASIALDFNRDGLLDVVAQGVIVLNERRETNRPPIVAGQPDRTLGYAFQFNQDDGTLDDQGSSDPDLHRLGFEWRDEMAPCLAAEVAA